MGYIESKVVYLSRGGEVSSDSFQYSRAFILSLSLSLCYTHTHTHNLYPNDHIYTFGQSSFYSSIIVGVGRNMNRMYVLNPNSKSNVVYMKSLALKKSSSGKKGNSCQTFQISINETMGISMVQWLN